MSESVGKSGPDHPNVVCDDNHECESVGPNVVKPNPDPSPPVISLEEDHSNHRESLAKLQENLHHQQFTRQQQQWSRHDDGKIQCYSNVSSIKITVCLILNGNNMLAHLVQSNCLKLPCINIERI